MTLLVDTAPGADGLVVQRCSLWGYNSIGVVSGGEACAVDPGITPDEVASFRATLEAGGRRVTRVILTHSHHDHIRGWDAFPGAEVIAPRVVAEKEAGPRARILAGKAKVDERLGVEDSAFRYPEVDRTFDERLEVRVGALDLALDLDPYPYFYPHPGLPSPLRRFLFPFIIAFFVVVIFNFVFLFIIAVFSFFIIFLIL